MTTNIRMTFYAVFTGICIYGFIVSGPVRHAWLPASIFAFCALCMLAAMIATTVDVKQSETRLVTRSV